MKKLMKSEKVFIKHVTDKGPISRMYKNSYKSFFKASNPIKKWVKHPISTSQKTQSKWAIKIWKTSQPC